MLSQLDRRPVNEKLSAPVILNSGGVIHDFASVTSFSADSEVRPFIINLVTEFLVFCKHQR